MAHALVLRGDSVVIVTNDSMKIGSGVSFKDGIEIVRLPCRPLLDGRLPLPNKNAEYRHLLEVLSERKWDGVLVNTRLFPLLSRDYALRRGKV